MDAFQHNRIKERCGISLLVTFRGLGMLKLKGKRCRRTSQTEHKRSRKKRTTNDYT